MGHPLHSSRNTGAFQHTREARRDLTRVPSQLSTNNSVHSSPVRPHDHGPSRLYVEDDEPWSSGSESDNFPPTHSAILPAVSLALPTYSGSGMDELAYFLCQLLYSEDKQVILRAIASATSWITEDPTNFTGSTHPVTPLVGLSSLSSLTDHEVPQTNFTDAVAVTAGEIRYLTSIDQRQLSRLVGAYLSVGDNAVAYLPSRQLATKFSLLQQIADDITGQPALSAFTHRDVLSRVHQSFRGYDTCRRHLQEKVKAHIHTRRSPLVSDLGLASTIFVPAFSEDMD